MLLKEMQTCMHGRLAPRAGSSATCSFLTGGRTPVLQTSHNRSTQAHRCRHSLKTVARAPEAGVGVFGTKAGMTQYFTPEGLAIGCTVIAFDTGNKVTQLKTLEKDGYNAVQVGYQEVPERKIPKPEVGHLKKAGLPALRHLREFKVKDIEGYEVGQQLSISEMFKEGDLLDIAGKSIGKGFQGEIKRWNHHRGPMSHGSKSHRLHGSTGASATPNRTFPGQKMSGHMGDQRVKKRKSKILKVDDELNLIVVVGSIPGKAGNLLEIAPAKIVGKNC